MKMLLRLPTLANHIVPGRDGSSPPGRSIAFPFLMLLFGVACGSSAPTQEVDQADTQPHLDFASEAYTLQPGEERYYCYTMRLPLDREVSLTKLAPTYGKATHHVLLSQTLVSEPDGFSECNVLTKNTWLPLYAAGVNSGPLSMPSGAGFKPLRKGQQLVMQLHLQNATSKPLTDKTVVRIEYAEATAATVGAGIFGFDNRVIDLPPMTKGATTTMSCKVERKLDVFALFAHMHKNGRRLQLSRGAKVGDEVLFDSEWNFDEQALTPLKTTINIGDTVHLRCHHDNPTEKPLGYGESSDDEMCVAVFFYTPYEALDGCVNER